MIDHQVVMVNAMPTPGNSSVVKFGGYDMNALVTNEKYTVLRSKDKTNFNVKSNTFNYGTENLLNGVYKDIHLNPHLPYLYIPEADWTHVAFQLNKFYNTSSWPIDCDYTGNFCRF
jgi:hypothetical protein